RMQEIAGIDEQAVDRPQSLGSICVERERRLEVVIGHPLRGWEPLELQRAFRGMVQDDSPLISSDFDGLWRHGRCPSPYTAWYTYFGQLSLSWYRDLFFVLGRRLRYIGTQLV